MIHPRRRRSLKRPSRRLYHWDGQEAIIEHDGACDLVVRRGFYPGWQARSGARTLAPGPRRERRPAGRASPWPRDFTRRLSLPAHLSDGWGSGQHTRTVRLHLRSGSGSSPPLLVPAQAQYYWLSLYFCGEIWSESVTFCDIAGSLDETRRRIRRFVRRPNPDRMSRSRGARSSAATVILRHGDRFDRNRRRRLRGATRPGDFRMLGSVKVESRTQRKDGPTPASPLASKIRLQRTLNAGRLPILRKTRPQLRMSPSEFLNLVTL